MDMRWNSIDEFVKYYKKVNKIPSKKRLDFWQRVDKELKERISSKPVFFHGPASITESKNYFLHMLNGGKMPHVEVGVYAKKYYSFVFVQVPKEDRLFYKRRKTLSEIVWRAEAAENVYVHGVKIPMKMFSLRQFIQYEKDVSIYFGTLQIDGQRYQFELDNASIFASTKIIPLSQRDNTSARLLYERKIPKHLIQEKR